MIFLLSKRKPVKTRVVAFMLLSLLTSQVGALVTVASCTTPSFRPVAYFQVGPDARHAVSADFNGDGSADMATANYGGPSVSVLMNDGTGVFSGPINLPLPLGLQALAAGDFNNDGRADIATANVDGFNVSVILSLPNNSFAAPITLNVTGQPFSIAAADFNNDGKADIAVGLQSQNSCSVFLGNGNGTFGTVRSTPVSQGPHYLVAGDFTGDGKIDLAASINLAVQILVGVGDGFFSFQDSCFPAPSSWISAGDLNGDGSLDLVTAWALSSQIFVLINNGQGCFTGKQFTGHSGPPLIGDFNGDGHQDFVVSNSNFGFSLYPGDGAGNFAAPVRYAQTGASFYAATDFNNDGKTDAMGLTGSDKLSVFFTGTGGFVNLAPGFGDAMDDGDVNGDGIKDLVISSLTGAAVFIGDGSGVFHSPKPVSLVSFASTVGLGDFNNDGKQDLAFTVTSGSTHVGIMLGDGTGAFSPPNMVETESSPGGIRVGDFNGDGKLDVITVHGFTSKLCISLGNGNGGLSVPVRLTTSVSPGQIDVADFNHDQKLDLAVPDFLGVHILTGDGNGSFSVTGTAAAGISSWGTAVADVNNDGELDVVALHANSNEVSIALNVSPGMFGTPVTFPLNGRPLIVAISEFNDDGKPDIVVGTAAPPPFGTGMHHASVFLNDGAGGFPVVAHYAVHRPTSLAVGDFSSDSRNDIVVMGSDGVISPLINTCTTALPQPVIQFSQAGYSIGEAGTKVDVTVMRSGDTSGTSSVNYTTTDTDNFTVGCSQPSGGNAFGRCDFATSVDTLTFAPGETSKTFAIPIINDAIAEGSETFGVTLSNATGGATVGAPATATVTITDNDAVTGPNPIFTTPFFVRQHYLDFLSREPEVGEPWSGVLNGCSDVNNNPACDRLTVSGSFFGSPEFQLKGLFVYRFYKLAFDRLPLYSEIVVDMRAVTGTTPAETFQKKATFTNNFVTLTEFGTLNAQTNTQYVNTLMGRYSLTSITTPDPANPDGATKVTLSTADLINGLNGVGGTLKRAQVLRAIADSDQVVAAEKNPGFVAMQYYGFLRRTPDTSGFNSWINHLNANPTDFRTMVNGFMNSAEYRLRFGPQN